MITDLTKRIQIAVEIDLSLAERRLLEVVAQTQVLDPIVRKEIVNPFGIDQLVG